MKKNKITSTFLNKLSPLGINGKSLVIALPFLWLLIFFLAPFGILLNISLSELATSVPPFKPLFTWISEHTLSIQLNFGNYFRLYDDSIYKLAFANSIKMAFYGTTFCLLIGYPIAYAITKAQPAMRRTLIMMVMLPFWTSFLIRVYAWIGMLSKHGFINNFLLKLGLVETPIQFLNSNFAVCLGIVYSYLPFMILPLYASISKIDDSLLEAAYDLGCKPLKGFLKVTLPLSSTGIFAGTMLVFIPAVGEFVIPELLGGPDTVMIGRVIWNEFFTNRDWPVATALAIVLIFILVVPLMFFQKLQPENR